jgi:hypothetical protein
MFHLVALHITVNDEPESGSAGAWVAFMETNINKCNTLDLE